MQYTAVSLPLLLISDAEQTYNEKNSTGLTEPRGTSHRTEIMVWGYGLGYGGDYVYGVKKLGGTVHSQQKETICPC